MTSVSNAFIIPGMSIPERLRKARKAAGYTQARVAQVFGISREAVALWESEGDKGTRPDIRKLQRLSELYDAPLSELIGGDSGGIEPEEKSEPIITREQREILHLLESLDKDAKDSWIRIGNQLSRIPRHNGENPGRVGQPIIKTDDYEGLDRRHRDFGNNPDRRRHFGIIKAKRLPKSPPKKRRENE